ncbi:hypothetical protein AB9M62_01775 [Bacillales bacterium AN1005]
MIILILSIIIFNITAFSTNKHLTKSQIVHIWTFTIALQALVDLYLAVKYKGYWYFTKDVDLLYLLPITVIIPPINMMFIGWYSFSASLSNKVLYFIYWLTFMLSYEVLILLPEPWGYFNYGWWNLLYSALLYPFLLLIVLKFYKWVCL